MKKKKPKEKAVRREAIIFLGPRPCKKNFGLKPPEDWCYWDFEDVNLKGQKETAEILVSTRLIHPNN